MTNRDRPTPILAADSATWTQKEAAAYLAVSPRYLRDSSCPKILLPGTGAAGRPIVRYDPNAVREWRDAYRSDRRAA